LQVHTSNVGPGSVLLQTSEDGVDCVVGYFFFFFFFFFFFNEHNPLTFLHS